MFFIDSDKRLIRICRNKRGGITLYAVNSPGGCKECWCRRKLDLCDFCRNLYYNDAIRAKYFVKTYDKGDFALIKPLDPY